MKIFSWVKEAIGEIWDFVDEYKGGIFLICGILLGAIVFTAFISSVADRECERHPDTRGCEELQMQKKTYGLLDAPLTKRDALILFQELKRECGTDYRNGDFK